MPQRKCKRYSCLARLLSLIVSAVSLVLLDSSFGLCEPVSMYGLQFPVDEQTPVDSGSVRVTIGSETQIVPSAKLADFVAQKTLQSAPRARNFSAVSLQRFIESALAAQDSVRAAWGVRGLLSHLGAEHDSVSNYLAALADRAEASEALQEVLGHGDSGIPDELWARIAAGVSPRNLPWIQARYPGATPKVQALIRDDLRQRCLAALRAREFGRLDGFIAVQRTVIGDQDPEFRDLTVLISRLRDALDRAGRGEMDPLFALADGSKGSKDAAELIAPFVINAAHQEVSEELKRGENTKALMVLARIDFSHRTPQTHELTRIALERVAESRETALANSFVDQYLRRISEVDPGLKQTYIKALDKQVRVLFESGRIDVAGDYVGKLSRVRPDPNGENDSIRLLQALAYLNRGMRASAHQTVSEIRTGIPLFGKMQLLWAGYYGDPISALLWVLIPSIIALMMWFRGRAAILLGTDKPPENPIEEEEDDEANRPSGFAITGARLMSPSMQEYNRCLQALGLKPGASLRQIKSHYRTLIKKVHPDLNKNLSAVEKERFVMLTKMYDRLIELRRELKFPES